MMLQEVARLGPTMFMGEGALVSMEPSKAGVQALTPVDLLMLPRSDAVRLLGPNFAQQLSTQGNLPSAKKVLAHCMSFCLLHLSHWQILPSHSLSCLDASLQSTC